MKIKHILYLAVFFAGLMAAGCEKYLEEMPQNKLKPSTTDDYDQLLNKAYLTEQVMPYLDILSDDVDLISTDHVMPGPDSGDPLVGAYMWSPNHEETMTGGDMAFEKFYESIFYTNLVIENIDDAIGMELNEANVERTRKNIKGEAMALRAYSYFYLVNLYAQAYDPATAAEEPGVPLNLSTAAEDKAYTRSSVAKIYEQMVTDLTEGIKLMEENPIQKAAKVKFDVVSAKALLARVYLYMQEWELAAQCASDVLKANGNLFNLHEAGERLTLEGNASTSWNANTVWGDDYLAKNNRNVIFVNGANELYPAMSYWPFITTFSVNRDLADQYEPNDVRRLYFMFTYKRDTYAGFREKLSFAKNRNVMLTYTMSPAPGSGYSRVIRTEEMLLILAEANVRKQTPDIPAAVGYLNQLREPKFKRGTYTPLDAADFNQQSLIDYITLERRRELCFEGHRWFDLRRTTRPAMERVGYENEKASLAKDDPRYVLQIPKREQSINPEIGVNPR